MFNGPELTVDTGENSPDGLPKAATLGDPLPMEQLASEAVEELRTWETLRQVEFDKWGDVYDYLHETSVAVSKRGNRLNNALAAFVKNRIAIDRAYAKSLMIEPPEFLEPDVDRGIVKILLDIQRKMGLHIEGWCGIMEKDLSRIVSEDGMVSHYEKNTEARIKQEVEMRAEVNQMHQTTCEDWLAHQKLYSEKTYVPDEGATKGLWETEALYRRQATLCQETQHMATKALEEALNTVNTLERWRVETTSKFVNGFGHKQHMSWTELQSITNNGIRLLSQYNSANNPRDRKKSAIESALESPTSKQGEDTEASRSTLQELNHLSCYNRLGSGSRFERFSGKLLRPPRNILNPLARWKETYVVITAYGYLHGWPIDEPKAREVALSVNCNDAVISKIKSDCFEIEEAAPQSWGVVFSTKKKITLKARTKEERNHWIKALEHFQQSPITLADVESSATPFNRTITPMKGGVQHAATAPSGLLTGHDPIPELAHSTGGDSKRDSAKFTGDVAQSGTLLGEKKPPPPPGRPSSERSSARRSGRSSQPPPPPFAITISDAQPPSSSTSSSHALVENLELSPSYRRSHIGMDSEREVTQSSTSPAVASTAAAATTGPSQEREVTDTRTVKENFAPAGRQSTKSTGSTPEGRIRDGPTTPGKKNEETTKNMSSGTNKQEAKSSGSKGSLGHSVEKLESAQDKRKSILNQPPGVDPDSPTYVNHHASVFE